MKLLASFMRSEISLRALQASSNSGAAAIRRALAWASWLLSHPTLGYNLFFWQVIVAEEDSFNSIFRPTGNDSFVKFQIGFHLGSGSV